MSPRQLPRHAALAALALSLVSCGGVPVGVSHADPTLVQRELTSNVLNSGSLSVYALQVLQRQDLYELWQTDPVAALAELHTRVGAGGQYRIFALSELSYAYAEQSGDRSYYLASAVYAWALLFPGDSDAVPLEASDPRVRVACDLYNRGLAEGLKGEDGEDDVRSGLHVLPFGVLDVTLDPRGLTWGGYRLERFVPAADLVVRGLRNRYRRAGIGAPLVARIAPEQIRQQEAATRRIPDLVKIPVTALMRIESARANLASGWLAGKLELHSQEDALTVEIDGQPWPLEFETSSALADTLDDSPWWDFELDGFFSGVFRTDAEHRGADDGLLLIHPYRPGLIPIVLVHGTASSPGRWADLMNELEIDRDIWGRYQIWLYMYNSGNPIGYSAGAMRGALEKAVRELDPGGTDPALRRMVVIGHSQGGLLAKLTAVDSGDVFWKLSSDSSFEDVRMDEDTRVILANSNFFTPEPFVARVIFICTPHRGSYLAAMSLSRLVGSFVALPSELTGRMREVLTLNEGALILRHFDQLPTSLDNMNPSSDFIQALAALPIAPGIQANSIIAVDGDGPLADASDGVVRYASAHIEGVESEKVVHSDHSAQGNPATIEEIRRILMEHLEQSGDLTPPARTP